MKTLTVTIDDTNKLEVKTDNLTTLEILGIAEMLRSRTNDKIRVYEGINNMAEEVVSKHKSVKKRKSEL